MRLQCSESVAHPVLVFVIFPQLIEIYLRLCKSIPGNIPVGSVHDLQECFSASVPFCHGEISPEISADPVSKKIGELFLHGKGNLIFHQSPYKPFCLLIGSEKDCRILQTFSRVQTFFQSLHDFHIFLSGIRKFPHLDRFSVRIRRGQLFGKTLFITVHHLHGSIQYVPAASVVYIQKNRLCFGIIFCKIQHDFRPGSPKTINGLVIIPHDKQIVIRCRKHTDNIILKRIDVLKLIHHNITEFLLPCL